MKIHVILLELMTYAFVQNDAGIVVKFAYACSLKIFTHGVRQSAPPGFSGYWQFIFISHSNIQSVREKERYSAVTVDFVGASEPIFFNIPAT